MSKGMLLSVSGGSGELEITLYRVRCQRLPKAMHGCGAEPSCVQETSGVSYAAARNETSLLQPSAQLLVGRHNGEKLGFRSNP
jgi:hypothetical protein